jgi:hypothetical protein
MLHHSKRRGAGVRRKDSSFSEEKEAERLHSFAVGTPVPARRKRIKVFWFFFTKKNALPCLPIPA